VVSVLDSGAVGPGFKSQPRRCRVTVLSKLFTPIVPLFTKQRNWLQPCRVARVTAESNGSLPLGLWLTSPAGWLPRTGISSGILRSVIEYGLPLHFFNPYRELVFRRCCLLMWWVYLVVLHLNDIEHTRLRWICWQLTQMLKQIKNKYISNSVVTT